MLPFTVVIPAYQPGSRLLRSMLSLAAQDFTGDLHVAVAVNDGSTETWRVAEALAAGLRSTGRRCQVLRTPPGRRAAFAAAEPLLPRGPRLYLDQDAELSTGAVTRLAQRLVPGTGYHFAALHLQPPRSDSWCTRAYYRAWSQIPYVRQSPATIGAYAVSAAGRERWGQFPDLHSDDKFVRTRFRPAERTVIDAEWYSVLPPEGLRELVDARRRYNRGNREVSCCDGYDVSRKAGLARMIARHPRSWPGFGMVFVVDAIAAAGELADKVLGHV